MGKKSILSRILNITLISIIGLSGINVVTKNTTVVYAATDTDVSSNKVENGSFEEPAFSGDSKHTQTKQVNVPYWHTTETDGLIELFKENNYYIDGVDLKPTDGEQAAEINAEEAGTLYQTVNTVPGSVYLWGLDHRARFGEDTMALVIGPSQENAPCKADGNKTNNDQMQQMVEWLKTQSSYQTPTTGEEPRSYTIYTKKFAENGGFLNNEDNTPFSWTYDSTYTEPFTIWIIKSSNDKWYSYGSNAISTTSSDVVNEWGNINTTQIDSLSYAYTVPSYQTSSIFGFVAVDTGYTGNNDKYTVGNFIDNIDFEIYNNLSASSTEHGSGAVTDSTYTNTPTTDITNKNPINIYTKYGSSQVLTAKINKDDKNTVTFSGAYITEQKYNNDGTKITETIFVTKDQWTETTDSDGNVYYTYSGLTNVTYALDVHFVFLRSPYITYDANGGTYQVSEGSDIYDFTPTNSDGSYMFKEPYTSSSATGSTGWVFTGWALYDENGQVKDTNNEPIILDAEHKIACDYDTTKSKQVFKVINGTNTFTSNNSEDGNSVTNTSSDNTYIYNKETAGLTLVAQWKFEQQIIPQTKYTDGYQTSTSGGSVKYTDVKGTAQTDGSSTYNATTDETIEVEAIANEGYDFEGWYDSDGNLLTVNTKYMYTVEKGDCTALYAKFSPKQVQKFIRQFQDENGNWVEVKDTETTTYPPLTCSENHDVDGKQAVSRVEVELGRHYTTVGWYDSQGNVVTTSDTLVYNINGNATYYAHLVPTNEVIYDYNGGTDSSNNTSKIDEVIPGNNETISDAPTKENYEFTGWKVKDTDTIYQSGKTIEGITEDITLVAQWKELPKVIYDLDGGKGSEGIDYSTIHVEEDGKTLVLDAPSKDGYEFGGWKVEETDKIYQPGEVIEDISSDTTLKAIWKQIEEDKPTTDQNDPKPNTDNSTNKNEISSTPTPNIVQNVTEQTSTDTDKQTPHNTGDESYVILWTSLMIVSISVLGIVVIKKKKYS